MKNKKGNVAMLTAIGWGLVMFAVIVGIGLTVLDKFWVSSITCPTAFPVWNATARMCLNSTGSMISGNGSASNAIAYVTTQLGSTGLAGWIPVVIVVLIAGLVMALFGGKKGY